MVGPEHPGNPKHWLQPGEQGGMKTQRNSGKKVMGESGEQNKCLVLTLATVVIRFPVSLCCSQPK